MSTDAPHPRQPHGPPPVPPGTPSQGRPLTTAAPLPALPASGEPKPRLLFCSYHCLVDPSSGAALSTRDLLTLLAGRGWSCRVFCGPQLDFEAGESLEQLLADQQVPVEVKSCAIGPCPFTLLHLTLSEVPFTLYRPSCTGLSRTPTREEGLPFLALLEQVLECFRPQLFLTYGGHWLAQEAMALARRRGSRVVFTLRNFAYPDRRPFQAVDAVHVPSRFSQEHYRRTLGLESTVIPGPWDWARVKCESIEGRYVTFINPQPHKGVFVFARIAAELGRQRPDIPLLVVEGRGQVSWLHQTGLDLSVLRSVHVMDNTPDPRDFYRVSRLVLMPSLWNESFGRVAAEALLNGIPVLASRRGALPEALAEAGFLFGIPERYTPKSRLVPTAAEVAPWVETIIRLWDDAVCYESERQRCLHAAEAWRPEKLAAQYEGFFAQVLASRGSGPLVQTLSGQGGES